MPKYLAARGDGNRDYAYSYQDAQGAPDASGRRYHSAVDWFGPADELVCAPLTGRVFDARRSSDRRGPVYGGVLGIERPDGVCVVMRHVNPSCVVGAEVLEGAPCAVVSPWDDGGPHAHVEIWRSRSGGYRHDNMVDPRAVEWAVGEPEGPPPAVFFFEELPHDQGGTGPVVVWHGRGSTKAAVALHRARGRICSTIRDAAGIGYVLWWREGTYPDLPIFGPWADAGARTSVAHARQANTGRTMRPFRTRAASLYPLAAAT